MHPKGGPKARFFIGHGFEPDEPAVLANALHQHAIAQTTEATVVRSEFGDRLRLDGPLTTPNRTAPRVRAIWQVERGADIAVFITAYPLG